MSEKKLETVLVTGGAGFIGSNLVDELLSLGHEVVVVDNESSEANSEFYWSDLSHNYKIDIMDYDSLSYVFKTHDPKFVFHLAAESRVQPSIDNPIKACKVNFLGTCNVLQCCRENDVYRIMFSSTSSAYGLNNIPPLQETMGTDCLNPYSVSKVAAEDLVKMYYTLYGLECVIFRYFNVYGERQPMKGQYAPVIGIFKRQLDAGEPMTIVGTGEQTRDFTHVKDVIQANLLAMNCKDSHALGSIFNIGTGRSHSVLEISKLIGGTKDFEVTHIPQRQGEANKTLADISKAKSILGYEPEINLESWIQLNT